MRLNDNHNYDTYLDENEPGVVEETMQPHNNEPKENRSKGSGQRISWSHIMSGIIGGAIVAFVAYLLISSGLYNVPDQNQSSTSESDVVETTNTETASSNIVQTTSTATTNSISNAISAVSDAVVGVSNIQQTGLWTESQEAGTGSGVIYKQESGKAYIVTNNHVVEGAKSVEVTLPSGEQETAQVLGADELTDLAVLVIDDTNVTQVATLGTSDSVQVGDVAIAIGNPLGIEFAGSVTQGIISGLERSVEMDLNSDGQADWTTEVIQTDAAINPGNSGGALINSNGEVIGINSMKIAEASVEGIGFAIPIDSAIPIIEELEMDGKVTRPFIGISAIPLSNVPERHKSNTLHLSEDVNEGVVIADVQVNSPADQSGLQQYDVITKINNQEISTMMELKQFLYSETNVDDTIEITFYREGNQQTTNLKLSEQKE